MGGTLLASNPYHTSSRRKFQELHRVHSERFAGNPNPSAAPCLLQTKPFPKRLIRVFSERTVNVGLTDSIKSGSTLTQRAHMVPDDSPCRILFCRYPVYGSPWILDLLSRHSPAVSFDITLTLLE